MVETNIPNVVTRPKFTIPRDIESNVTDFYGKAVLRHWEILSSVTPDAKAARPFMFITILPEVEHTDASSSRNRLSEARYAEIDRDLNAIQKGELSGENFEVGAVDTAKALVAQIRSKQIAPPELSWMGTDAIIMLWVIGRKKLALTITDGEFGYTLRYNRKTIRRESNIAPNKLDLLRLR